MTKLSKHTQRENTLRSRILGSTSTAGVAVALVLGSAVVAEAQETEPTTTVEEDATADEKREDVVIVRGIRGSLEDAVNVKRNSDTIVDGISAEGIGKFPDLNLAESIQRIAGIQIIRDDTRNGQVAIRGIPGFTKTQINGQDLAGPNFSGSFVYGIFESSVLSGVDVYKTPKVSMDAGGIAGAINLKTRNALDFEDDRHLFISVKGQKEQLNGAVVPDIGMATGFKNAAGDFGAYISFGYQERDFRSDSGRITEYLPFSSDLSEYYSSTRTRDPASTSSVSGGLNSLTDAELGDLTYVPYRARYTARGTTGERISIAGGAEWEVSDELSLNLTGIFADSQSEQPLNQITLNTFGTRAIDFDVLATDNGSGGFGRTATSVRWNGPQMQVQERIRDQDFQTWAATLDADWARGPWDVHGALHFTRGETRQSQVQVTSRYESRNRNGSLVDNGLEAIVNTGGGDPFGFGFVLNQDPSDVNTFGWTTTNGPDNDDHLFAGIFAGSTNNYERVEDQFAVQIDVSREFDLPVIASIDVGLKYKQLGQDSLEKRFRNSFNGSGVDLSIWDNSFFQNSFLDDGQGFLGERLSAFQGLQVPDALRALNALPAPDPTTLGDGDVVDEFTGLVYNINGSGRFDNTQDITAAYASLNLAHDLGPVGLRGNVGFRFVDTQRVSRTTTGTDVRVGGTTVSERVDVQAETDFDHFLPQVNLIFDITEDLVIRGSYSETLSRPNPNSIRAGNFIRVDDTNIATGELRIRAFSDRSALEPEVGKAYDLAFEWYNRSGSAVHGALFTKEITNFVVVTDNCPATVLGVEDLIVGTTQFLPDPNGGSNPICQDEAGNQIFAQLRRNTDESITVSGVELGTTQNFDFLDGWMSNFGVTANYTYLEKKDETTDGRSATVLSLSPHSFNLIGYYETDRYGIRLAGNFRSHFVDGNTNGGFTGGDRIVDDRLQWDMSGSYEVNDNFGLGFEIVNLFDQERFEYQGYEGRFRNVSSEGRTLTVSGSYTF